MGKKKSRGKIRRDVAGAAVESHPVNYRGEGRQIIAEPTANPIIAGLMVSPVARATSAADPGQLVGWSISGTQYPGTPADR